ncbi:unnamed protein product [Schistosoma rodhaini]|nr:unnamed protein product [Schistosoma rodhaini]
MKLTFVVSTAIIGGGKSLAIHSFFVLKDPSNSHSMSDFCASLDSISASLRVHRALTSSYSKYNTISAEANLLCSACVQWVSLILRTTKLYCFISTSIWLVFTVCYMVQTSHAPMLIVALVVRMSIDLATSEESRLLPRGIITIPNEESSIHKAEYKCLNLFIPVTVFCKVVFYGIRFVTLCPNFLYLRFGPTVTLGGLQGVKSIS